MVGRLWTDSWQHVARVKLSLRARHRLLSLIIAEDVVGCIDRELVTPNRLIIEACKVFRFFQEDLMVDDSLDVWQARAVHRVK